MSSTVAWCTNRETTAAPSGKLEKIRRGKLIKITCWWRTLKRISKTSDTRHLSLFNLFNGHWTKIQHPAFHRLSNFQASSCCALQTWLGTRTNTYMFYSIIIYIIYEHRAKCNRQKAHVVSPPILPHSRSRSTRTASLAVYRPVTECVIHGERHSSFQPHHLAKLIV